MAVPKRRTSKQRKHLRRSNNFKLEMPGMNECPQCHKPKLAHRVCKFCGYYKGKQILKVEESK